MSFHSEEYESPLLGAYLIWRFVIGFSELNAKGPNLLLAFPALTIAMSSDFSRKIDNFVSLSDYAYASHDTFRKRDVSLGGLQGRINRRRKWVLKALEFAIVMKLVALNVDTGTLIPLLKRECESSSGSARKFKAAQGLAVHKIGGWFAKTEPTKLAYYLGVIF